MKLHPLAFLGLSALVSSAWLGWRGAQEIERNAHEYMRAHEIGTGFTGSVLLARGDEILLSAGYGFADIERGIPNDTRTQYRIGSITKPFTAIAILLLQEQRVLSVDDSICEHVEPCPAHWQPITLHHLLSHTAGIVNLTNEGDYLTMTAQPTTREQMLETLRERALRFVPGERFEYSNSGYYLLGVVIEKTTGRSFGDVLADSVFQPLGMADSGYGSEPPAAAPPAPGAQAAPPRFAIGYRPDEDGVFHRDSPVDASWSFAAGGLYSTVEDLFRWSRALDAGALLSPASREAMWTPRLDDYGYGWRLAGPAPPALGRPVRLHGGRIQGFTACFARFPADDLTAIVLSNNVMADTCGIARDLAAMAFGEDYTKPIARRAIRLDAETLERYTGRYRSGTLVISVVREGDRLFVVTPGSNDRLRLYPESEKDFFLKTFDAQVTFTRDRRGNATELVARAQNRTFAAERIED